MSDEFKPTVRIHRGKYGAISRSDATTPITNTAAPQSAESIFDLESGSVGPLKTEPTPTPAPQVQSMSRREPTPERVVEQPPPQPVQRPQPKAPPIDEAKLKQMVARAKREVERPKPETPKSDNTMWYLGLAAGAVAISFMVSGKKSEGGPNQPNNTNFDPSKHF